MQDAAYQFTQIIEVERFGQIPGAARFERGFSYAVSIKSRVHFDRPVVAAATR